MTMMPMPPHPDDRPGLMERIVRFCLHNRLPVLLLVAFVVAWGAMVAPFDWDLLGVPRNPVPVDAIPDIGENQQIVFTQWSGRSPQDVEDQITYPLTVALLGIPGVKTVRSFSMFGFSSIYVIFQDSVEFYWSRSRLLEKLSSLPPGTLPTGVTPMLGPDATALGQIFWYTLEGRDKDGHPAGGWDPAELRSIQDWYVRYALASAEGVSEAASVGGYVKEYQVDVDPDALRAAGVSLEAVLGAVRMSNLDVGARTIERNGAEYVIRGLGFLKGVKDLENSVVTARDNKPIRLRDVAHVHEGPALRRGALDKGGSEAVGGVVVVRYGANPLTTIKSVKEKIAEITPGLPSKVLPDGRVSKVTIVPFYDRTGLIHETLGTLNSALVEETLVAVVVVVVSVMHLASSLVISSLLPLAILMTFIAMKLTGVDANIVALSGIAIAIGVMVDVGIIVCENILKHFDEAPPGTDKLDLVARAVAEVGGAVLTAVSMTVISFLPVFSMQGAEGKLFKPLAFTKTYALLASIVVGMTVLPVLAHVLFRHAKPAGKRPLARRLAWPVVFAAVGLAALVFVKWWVGLLFFYLAARLVLEDRLPRLGRVLHILDNAMVVLAVTTVLAEHWLPLGPEKGTFLNVLFAAGVILGIMLCFKAFQHVYPRLLAFFLRHKRTFLLLPAAVVVLGAVIWMGFPTVFGWLPESLRLSGPGAALARTFPGLGKEFMPPLDEGAFLYMPTTMPHAALSEVETMLAMQDKAILALPEVETAVGKLGRAETPLDPAPISMIETVINYKPEYLEDASGNRLQFKFDPERVDYFRNADGRPQPGPDGLPYLVRGTFVRDAAGKLIPEDGGRPFRLWRPALDPQLNPNRKAWPGVKTPNDIWEAIVAAARVPGMTSAPKLQPIAARLVMLQSGMRAPMGIKIHGPTLEAIEGVGLQIERLLKQVPSVAADAVIADRIVGKPYLEIVIDRDAISRYGIMIGQVQDVIQTAIGGMPLTSTVEGRERYPVRVRYMRELRDDFPDLKKILVAAPGGQEIPLEQLASIRYVRGPQVIKSEDTFLTGYVLFDKKPGFAEVDVVEQAKAYLEHMRQTGELELPPGVSYVFAGNYENQIRAQKRLSIVLPLSLAVIFLILYFQFRSTRTALFVFSGILVAWSGGFLMIWFYGQDWFLNFHVFGTSMRELFQVHPINLSVAIWVGFLALFGIAADDGVLMATYLDQSLTGQRHGSVAEVRLAVLEGAKRRIRPALMTAATTILALLPILTSRGRGADIMVPMAIPSFGGMTIAILSVFIVPILYCWVEERKLKRSSPPRAETNGAGEED
ncbi:MAG: efflux RND transporter permease subunit [Desulfovibrio sp.]